MSAVRLLRSLRRCGGRSGLAALVCVLFLLAAAGVRAESWRVGTWKTAQTIQPYFFGEAAGGGAHFVLSPL